MKRFLSLLTGAFFFLAFDASAQNSGWVSVGDLSQATQRSAIDLDSCTYRLALLRSPTGKMYFHFNQSQVFQLPQALGQPLLAGQFVMPIGNYELSSLIVNGNVPVEKARPLAGKYSYDFDARLIFYVREGSPAEFNLFVYTPGQPADRWYLSVANTELQKNCTPAAALTGLVATASATYSSAYAANLTVDGNQNSYWIGGINLPSQSITLSLGGNRSLENLKIDWYTGYESTNFNVETSTDGVSFNTAATGLNRATNVSLTGRATHVRITMLSNSSLYPVIRELSVTGR